MLARWNRRFREQVGTTPLQWLLDARVRRAREMLETTDFGIAAVVAVVGFEDPASLRQRFQQALGVSPAAYRRAFADTAAAMGRATSVARTPA